MAEPRHGELASSLSELFSHQGAPAAILEAAKRLFWALATMSLVWSMGVLLLRRADFGEFFLELFRFMLFTGLFYWLLIEASTKDGFVYAIFDSFKEMSGVSDATSRGDTIIQVGLDIFYKILDESQNWKEADVLVASGLSITMIVALTLLSAQIVLMVIMAWMLAYAGIFLLGMGGARWTSPIAVSFYKHVLALGAALLFLSLLLKVGQGFLETQADQVLSSSGPAGIDYVALADMFVVSLLMSLLGIKLPGLIYTLVTGSPLGLLPGVAGMAGTAITTGGGHVYSSVMRQGNPFAGDPRLGAGTPRQGDGGGGNAVDAIRRAAAVAPMEESVFEPFDPQSKDASASVFTHGYNEPSWKTQSVPQSSSEQRASQAAAAANQAAPQGQDRDAGRRPAGSTSNASASDQTSRSHQPQVPTGSQSVASGSNMHQQATQAHQAQGPGAPMPNVTPGTSTVAHGSTATSHSQTTSVAPSTGASMPGSIQSPTATGSAHAPSSAAFQQGVGGAMPGSSFHGLPQTKSDLVSSVTSSASSMAQQPLAHGGFQPSALSQGQSSAPGAGQARTLASGGGTTASGVDTARGLGSSPSPSQGIFMPGQQPVAARNAATPAPADGSGPRKSSATKNAERKEQAKKEGQRHDVKRRTGSAEKRHEGKQGEQHKPGERNKDEQEDRADEVAAFRDRRPLEGDGKD
jgi:type IV secretion system protein VirB6/type IV secretion system protein TrbL